MEIPLVLRARSDGALVYEVPILFRAAMAALLALIALAQFMDGGAPGPAGWVAMAIVALAALYEERWTFDTGAGAIEHRAGLLIAARRRGIPLGQVSRIRVAPLAQGAAPRARTYACILVETEDGARHCVTVAPARRGPALAAQARRIAEACGKSLVEGS